MSERNPQALERELSRLTQALPKTEDGVTVVPGMSVFYEDIGGRISEAIVKRVWEDMWEVAGGGQPYFIRDGSTPYFSTELLARKYRANRLRAIAEKAEAEAQATICDKK